MKMSLPSENIPYRETNKAKTEKVRNQIMNQHIDEMKTLLIARGFGTERDLSSREKVLFKVVQLVTTEDLLSNYPRLHLKGNESSTELHKAREKYRRGKQDIALEKLKGFIRGAGIGKWRNIKDDLERIEVLKLILKHIQEDGSTYSTAVPSPCSSQAPTSSVSPALNASTASQTNVQTTGHVSFAGSSLPSSPQAQWFNNGSFPVVSSFPWNKTLPAILPTAMHVPFVPYVSAYNLYNSTYFMLNSFMNTIPNNVAASQLPKVKEENDKSEEEDVIIDIIGNGNSELKHEGEDDRELDVIK